MAVIAPVLVAIELTSPDLFFSLLDDVSQHLITATASESDVNGVCIGVVGLFMVHLAGVAVVAVVADPAAVLLGLIEVFREEKKFLLTQVNEGLHAPLHVLPRASVDNADDDAVTSHGTGQNRLEVGVT